MQSRAVRFGLIVGAIGLFANICVSAVIGICGPLAALVGGAVAGWLAVRGAPAVNKGAGARQGAVAGGIAGGLMLVGQMVGGVLALLFLLNSGAQPLFGTMPDAGDPSSQIGFWVGGLGAGLCFGAIGAGLAAGSGALAAYLATPEQPGVAPQV